MKVETGDEAGFSQLYKVEAKLSMQSGGDVQAFKNLYQSLRIRHRTLRQGSYPEREIWPPTAP